MYWSDMVSSIIDWPANDSIIALCIAEILYFAYVALGLQN